jgi:ATP-dependent Clp protease ATP-binding subunit ClpA
MPNNLETFSQKSRLTLSLSQKEAEALGHKMIGTQHVLLAMLHDDIGETQRPLKNAGLDYDQLRKQIQASNDLKGSKNKSFDLAVLTKRMLELAVDEARSYGHGDIRPEHLLIGLLQQLNGETAQILHQFGIDTVSIIQQVRLSLPENPVVSQARLEAQQLMHQYIEPEHLLLAVVNYEDSQAHHLLNEIGLTYLKAKGLIQKLIRHRLDNGQILQFSHEMHLVLKASLVPGKELSPDYFLFILVRENWPLQRLFNLAGIDLNAFRRRVYQVLPEVVPENLRKALEAEPVNPLFREFRRAIVWWWHFIPQPIRQLILRLFRKQE